MKSNRSGMVVFLGNPGREHERSRHNCGWMVAYCISREYSVQWQEKFSGEFGTLRTGSRKVFLLKPTTFMNLSGLSVSRALSYFSVPVEDCTVVHDDVELPFGKIVLKRGGGTGGHNGLKSIVRELGKNDFSRLRIGIGRPQRGPVSSFVLGRFTPEEEAELPDVIRKAAEMLIHEVF